MPPMLRLDTTIQATLRGTGILPVHSSARRRRPRVARASSPCIRSTDSPVRALGLGQDGPSHCVLGRDAQATSVGGTPTLRGTASQTVSKPQV
ncbi:MAG: hypothetical protein NZ874_04280 [Fimbriimonadales bacterium]|nr:hypothetical protein [Fimbriimonadales bacterium]